jgi:VWFA-related protein
MIVFMRRLLPALLLILLSVLLPAAEQPKLIVQVRNQFGFPIKDLKAADFAVTEDKAPREVAQAVWVNDSLADVMLLLDTSDIAKQLRGEIEGAALLFVKQRAEKEQLGVIAYSNSADLVQDFTSSPELLRRAITRSKYGNAPRLLDALYAAIDSGFEHSAGRKVLVVIGSGLDARAKVTRQEVVTMAQRREVSVCAISFEDYSDLEKIAQQTAGDYYTGRQLKQMGTVVENLVAGFAGHYELTLPGAPLDAARLKVEVKRDERPRVSFRPVP